MTIITSIIITITLKNILSLILPRCSQYLNAHNKIYSVNWVIIVLQVKATY